MIFAYMMQWMDPKMLADTGRMLNVAILDIMLSHRLSFQL